MATGVAIPFGTVSLGGTFLRPDLPEPEPGQAPNPGYRTLERSYQHADQATMLRVVLGARELEDAGEERGVLD